MVMDTPLIAVRIKKQKRCFSDIKINRNINELKRTGTQNEKTLSKRDYKMPVMGKPSFHSHESS